MFKNWKTTLAGIIGIGCTVGAIAFPEFAIPIGKIGAVVTAGGLFLSKDHDVTHSPTPDEEAGPAKEKKRASGFRTPRMMLLIGFLSMGGFLLTSGFTGMGVRTAPLIYTGTGSPTNFPSAVGSFYVNLANTNVPVLWIKTTTNGFAAFISSNALPADVRFNTVFITNGLLAGDVIATNTLQSAGTLNVDGMSYLGVDSEGNPTGGGLFTSQLDTTGNINVGSDLFAAGDLDVYGSVRFTNLLSGRQVWTTNASRLVTP